MIHVSAFFVQINSELCTGLLGLMFDNISPPITFSKTGIDGVWLLTMSNKLAQTPGVASSLGMSCSNSNSPASVFPGLRKRKVPSCGGRTCFASNVALALRAASATSEFFYSWRYIKINVVPELPDDQIDVFNDLKVYVKRHNLFWSLFHINNFVLAEKIREAIIIFFMGLGFEVNHDPFARLTSNTVNYSAESCATPSVSTTSCPSTIAKISSSSMTLTSTIVCFTIFRVLRCSVGLMFTLLTRYRVLLATMFVVESPHYLVVCVKRDLVRR